MLEESSTIVDLSSQPGPIVTPRSRNTPPRRYAVPATKHAAEIMAGGLIIAPGPIVASLWARTLADLRKDEDSSETANCSMKRGRSIVSCHGCIVGARR